tara:strand:- start:635 stop:1390 length:756 start_codon:yes stop_codon:yes gene_type:complete
MRIKFNKEIEFFLKKYLFPKTYLLKRRLERSIKNNDEYEIKLVKDFIKKGTDSLDIGVYRGVYSYEMSKYSKIVHSFEPNPIIFNDLKKNLKKIIPNMNLYNFALSNKNENLSLKVPIRNSNVSKENYEEYYKMGKASIHDNNIFDEYEKFKINSKKIDDLKFDNLISFIKIDVEGHEEQVIDGAIQTIKKHKPIMLVEIVEKYTGKNVSKTINFINSLGYKSYYFDNKALKKTQDLNNLNLFNNYIFFPD